MRAGLVGYVTTKSSVLLKSIPDEVLENAEVLLILQLQIFVEQKNLSVWKFMDDFVLKPSSVD